MSERTNEQKSRFSVEECDKLAGELEQVAQARLETGDGVLLVSLMLQAAAALRQRQQPLEVTEEAVEALYDAMHLKKQLGGYRYESEMWNCERALKAAVAVMNERRK